MPETAARNDPPPAFRFEVRIDDLPPAGFTECSGLQIETEVEEFPEGGLNSHMRRFPTRTSHANITLRRGIVDRSLWTWYDDLVQGRVTFRSGSIVVHDAAGARVEAEWAFRGAFPCRWNGPDLDAMQSAVAVEMLELCHDGLERRR